MNTAEPKKRVRKAKVVVPAANAVTDADEAALLMPVDMPVADAVADPVADASDMLRNHASRLSVVDPTRCVSRTHGDEVAGTKPGDAGANGKFYHEKQCTRKRVPGNELCIGCAEKEKKHIASNEGRWYGRLTQPLIDKSYVVGCAWFWKKYPNGIPSDPTTHPAQTHVAIVAPAAKKVAVPDEAPAPVAKKAPGRPKKVAVPDEAPVPVAKKAPGRPKKVAAPAEVRVPAVPVAEAVLDENAPPVKPSWIYFVIGGSFHARNPLTHNVYYVNIAEPDHAKQIMMNRYVGRWQPDTSTIDRFALEDTENDE